MPPLTGSPQRSRRYCAPSSRGLAPGSIAAQRDATVDPAELKLRFLVRAEIRADPLNVPVEFVADLERDTGRIRVAQR